MRRGRRRQDVTLILAAITMAAFTGPVAAEQLSTISSLSAEARAAMTGKSWQDGCPVSLDDLAAVSVTYFGYDGETHKGTLVIHKQLAEDASAIFDELYKAKFPIDKVVPWEAYGSRVYAQQNDTVSFYCEKAQDDTTHWSSHAYGYAIDINPLVNPFHDAKQGWWPPGADKYAPRDDAKGKVLPGGVVFQIMADHGFAWGGFYKGDFDYMHFFKVTDGSEDPPPNRPYAAKSLQYRPGNSDGAPAK